MMSGELETCSHSTIRFRGPPVWRRGGRSRFRVYLAAVIFPDAGSRLAQVRALAGHGMSAGAGG